MDALLSKLKIEDVHHLLDALSSSMDWGSGFLDDDDVAAWNRVAEATGYSKVAVKSYKPDGYFILEDRKP